jgi:PAS domain S-box-containing protein
VKAQPILIVDDDAGHCANLVDILELEGYTAVSALSAREARRVAKRHKPQVFLLDQRLPDGSGTALLAEFKQRWPDCHGIIITAHADLDSAVAALDQGAYYYLRKPFRVDELLGLLKRIFEAIRLREQKREAERALLESQDKLAGIINAVADAMLMIDDQGKIAWANERGRQVFGPELEGQAYFTILYDGFEAPADCIVRRCFEDGEQYDMEMTITPGDGRRQDFWCTTNPVLRDAKGHPHHVILVCRNTTEKKRLQAEAARNAHLAALGELAAGVAHEINNPINGIINYAQILVDQEEAVDPCESIPRRIIKEGDRIAAIVSKLLSFARDRKDEMTPLHLGNVLQDALDLTGSLLDKDHIQLRIDLAENLPNCCVNGQQIQQVFLNLISNARYALNQRFPDQDPDKMLEIQLATMTEKEPPFVMATFTDYGSGIPEEHLQSVFNPFFSTKPSDQGTGLGLSISFGIVENHGGRMAIDSEEGDYTRVTIELPVKEVIDDG